MLIKFAETEEEIKQCFTVMAELRTNLKDANDFICRVFRQQTSAGYKIAYLKDNNQVKSAAGIRIIENLAWGKFLYIDDLVTLSSAHSQGYGQKLFDWVLDYAIKNNCDQLHLDSGVQRFKAHRFYLMKNMDITSHHFALKLK